MVGKLSDFKHGVVRNILSIGLSFIIVGAVFALWWIARLSVPTFCISIVGIILLASAAIVYDAMNGPIFNWDFSGFVIQSAPIFSSSLIAGWGAHELFYQQTQITEEAVVLLLVSLIVTLFSIFNIGESVFRSENDSLDHQKERRQRRIALMLNLLIVHGAMAFVAGVLVSKSF